MDQDEFYLKKESDAFFDRWLNSSDGHHGSKFQGLIRPAKKQIYDHLSKVLNLDNKSVLEIGCFIGDLLNLLKTDHSCDVYGIESSGKACNFAKEKYSLNFEHSTFSKSSKFNLELSNKCKYDVIVCDDVLSWVQREDIIPSLGVIDWLLKPEGHLYFRDFSPSFGFAYQNHHWPEDEIYNFKQPGGHRQFFLLSGKYVEVSTSLRISDEYQHFKTKSPDSMIWSDTIMQKLDKFLHPVRSES